MALDTTKVSPNMEKEKATDAVKPAFGRSAISARTSPKRSRASALMM